MKNDNIYLIGPLGTGKTSVGKLLAKLMGRPFYDSDHEIVSRTGVDIPWIFEQEGESGFRVREAAMIAELTAMSGIILATGGGAVVTESNRKHLTDNGVVVYLRISTKEQMQRVQARKSARPLLKIYNTEEKLAQLNASREPYYQKMADLVYQTDALNPREIAEKILKDIETFEHHD